MEKLDKETLAINYLNSVSSYDIESLISMGNKTAIGGLKTYKAGLEYAENHYLKLIWEKDDIISQRNEVLGYRNDDINRLKSELQQAKQEHAKSCDDFGRFREKLQSELTTTKELLKELKQNLIYIDKESMNIGCEDEIKKIEEFLNQ